MKKTKKALINFLIFNFFLLSLSYNTNAENNFQPRKVSRIKIFFQDISSSSYKTSIELLHSKCNIEGYEDQEGNLLHEFKPEKTITRAEIIKMLTQCHPQNNEYKVDKNGFIDVEKGTWYYAAITEAKSLGWLKKYGDEIFRPHKSLTKAEGLENILLSRFSEKDFKKTETTVLKDIPKNSWYTKYFQFAVSQKLVSAESNGNFYPEKNLTREEAANLIVKVYGLNPNDKSNLEKLSSPVISHSSPAKNQPSHPSNITTTHSNQTTNTEQSTNSSPGASSPTPSQSSNQNSTNNPPSSNTSSNTSSSTTNQNNPTSTNNSSAKPISTPSSTPESEENSTLTPNSPLSSSSTFFEAAENLAVAFGGPDGITLTGRLYKPAGNGPFPAVVFMHGCEGLFTGTNGDMGSQFIYWGKRMKDEEGIVALFVDSFSPRQITDGVCGDGSILNEATERPKDAYAGLNYLRNLPFIKDDKIALMGWSNGASATLSSVALNNNPVTLPAQGGFITAIAEYPGCGLRAHYGTDYSDINKIAQGTYLPYVPTIILAGENDSTTPPDPKCINLVNRAQQLGASSTSGNPISITIYPGTEHGFDRAKENNSSWTANDITARNTSRITVINHLRSFLK